MSSVFKKLQRKNNALALHEEIVGEQMSGIEASDETKAKRQKIQDDMGESEKSSDEEYHDEEKAQKEEKSKHLANQPEDPDFELKAFVDAEPESKAWKNRQRVLFACQRGINGRHVHLMNDLISLVPHSKQEAKIEREDVKLQIDSLCYERSCNNFVYFESRNHKVSDMFMWISKSPSGPAYKFMIENIHTHDELKLTGNCLKYSRPLVSFDGHFDDVKKPWLQLCKELLSQTFNTPKNHPKSKPFIDHVISFTYFEDKIYFRNYQILNQNEQMFKATDDISKLVLIEIGPRFTMNPIKAFDGSMGGEALWQNPNYIAPSKIRSKKYATFAKKRDLKEKQKLYKNRILEEGKDPNSYLQGAFDDSQEEEDNGGSDNE